MGPMTTLLDLVKNLESLDEDSTIYASEPWTCESPAVVAVEPASGGVHAAASKQVLKYFLEVSIARDFLRGWESSLDKVPSDRQRCERLIRYAEDDA